MAVVGARVHLSGAGWREDESAVYGPFLDEAADRARGRPTVVVVLHAPDAPSGAEWHEAYRDDLDRIRRCDVRIHQLVGDEVLDPAALASADGVVVGGGITPAYHRALAPATAAITALVDGGVPYCGISAGAMIAPARALLGGRSHEGVAVVPADWDEGLAELTIAAGLGLVDVAVDAHVAQAGTLGRLVAAVEGGLVESGIGIDEQTAVIADGGSLAVVGHGRAWLATRAGDGVNVRSYRAGATIAR